MDAGKLIALVFGFHLIIYVGGVCWTRPVNSRAGSGFRSNSDSRVWRNPSQPRLLLRHASHGSSVRLRPARPNHVWSYDFVSARTQNGRAIRILT